MGQQIPLVDYLVLGDDPHLVAHECTACGARFFDRRNACASCSGTDFVPARVATEGELRAFTIVSFAAPGVQVPFVAGVVDCDGTSVRGNIVNVEPDPDHVHTGLAVRLTTVPVGTDEAGTEAVGFGFEPIEGNGQDTQEDAS
ncbi:MAG TPA: OB-fold domain-containing protein [Acidimicrobiales bacterium]|nr:OB-fold domain-containing protein [Acidimicrobiales bacterium]